jgi:hypothetical protein
VFDNFAVLIEAEYVYSGVIVVSRPLLETMQDNEIILGYRALELHALSGILLRHSGEIFDESLLAVWHSGVVLNVEFAHILLDTFCRLAMIQHQVVKGRHRRFVFLNVAHRGSHCRFEVPLVKIFLLLITSLGSFPISVFYRLI